MMTLLIAVVALSEATFVRMPPMKVSPVIDGTVSKEEGRGTSAWYGPISDKTGLMTIRYGMFFLGYDAKGFYFATRTQTPKLPQPLTDADAVTLTLLPPGATAPKTFTVRVKDAVNDVAGVESKRHAYRGVTDFGLQVTETESFIPYAALGVPMPKDGDRWGLQVAVRFAGPDETGYWHWNKANPAELGTFVADSGAMMPSFHSFGHMESFRATAWYKLLLRFKNDTGRDQKLSSKCVAHMGIAESKLDSNPSEDFTIKHKQTQEIDGETVKAGTAREFRHEDVPLWMGNINVFEGDVSAEGKQLLKRRIAWDLGKGLSFKDPVWRPSLKSAFFPSAGNLLRVYYHRGGVENAVKAEIRVLGADGKTYWLKEIEKGDKPRIPDQDVFVQKLPDLPLQDYRVVFTLTGADGKVHTDEKTFAVRKFDWQGLELGKDRVVIPPFRPIKVEGWRGGEVEKCEKTSQTSQTISFLQTGYRCGGVLWDAIYAEGENLLTGPVTLKLNGQEFKVQDVKFKEVSPDRVVREVSATLSTSQPSQPSQLLNLRVTQEYDYDGFCMVTFDFEPTAPVTVKSLVVSAPLRNELAKIFEVQRRDDKRAYRAPDFTLPDGEGEVWNSATHVKDSSLQVYKAYVQPYIWYGDSKKGLATLLTTPKDMSHNDKDVVQRIVRKNGAATLTQDFVMKEVVWDSPKKIQIAFQPSPVKPMNWADQRYANHMYGYQCPSNAVCMTTGYSGFWCNAPIRSTYNILPNDDRGLIDFCKAHRDKPAKKEFYAEVDKYIARNADWFETNRWNVTAKAFKDLQTNHWRLTGVGQYLCYYDPVLISCFWPEWEMYKADWYVDEWPQEDLYNEYLGNMPSNYIDFLLYHMRNTLKQGAEGFFFDCYSLHCNKNFASSNGRAYFTDKYTVQYHFGNIVHWRELVKRTATLCYKMGAMQNGRPSVMVHATDGIMLPVCSFASSVMVTERGGKGGDIPDAYPESYILSDVTGFQCGVSSAPIMKTLEPGEKTEPQLKSLMAFMCAYGIFHLEDQGTLYKPWFDKAWNIVFDYGWGKPEVTGHYYYDQKPQPVKHTGKNVRLTVAEKKGESALLMFGNLGDAEDIVFDWSGLGLGFVRLKDAETGKSLPGGTLHVDRHGYRLVLVERHPDAPKPGAKTERLPDREVFVRGPNYDVSKIAPYVLEDPVTSADGTKVTCETWPQRRREILDVFASEMYGKEPPAPEAVVTELVDEKPSEANYAIRRQYRMWFKADRSGPCVNWIVWIPRTAKKPVPVISFLNYEGNQTLTTDTDVPVCAAWIKNGTGVKDHRATEATRGAWRKSDARVHLPLGVLLARGYAVMSACYAEVSPDPNPIIWVTDYDDYPQHAFAYTGVFDLWPKRDPKRGDNTTATGAWGWALSRGLDLAERIPEIDAKKCVVTGYSRLGKAALMAGARDERFAVTVPIQTGGGGCPLAKRDWGENVSTLNRWFPHWFCANYAKYAEDPTKTLTFDQHLFLACVAPRALLIEGFGDPWYDSEGEYLALQAARPAWRLFGKSVPADGKWPAEYDTSAIAGDLGYVRRDNPHGIADCDWLWMLDFADRIFKR